MPKRKKLKLKYMPISEIKPYKNNPRTRRGCTNELEEVIYDFGFLVPILVDKDNVIICGHSRYYASKKLGLTDIPVIYDHDLTPEQAHAFRIKENLADKDTTWDYPKLKQELEMLHEFGFDVSSFHPGGTFKRFLLKSPIEAKNYNKAVHHKRKKRMPKLNMIDGTITINITKPEHFDLLRNIFNIKSIKKDICITSSKVIKKLNEL